MPHLGPPSVSLKTFLRDPQADLHRRTSLCRSDHEDKNWNLRLQGVWGGLSLLQSVSGPPHGLPPQITPICPSWLLLLPSPPPPLSLPCFCVRVSLMLHLSAL